MEPVARRAFFSSWSAEPIHHVSISASGLIALADLSTVAQRTALTGGASWLDSLLLVPGLHYQQAADALARGTVSLAVTATETARDASGAVVTYTIGNQATISYLQRVARPGQVVTLDVGQTPPRYRRKTRRRQSLGQRGTVWAQDDTPDLGWLSHLLYLISPLLTCVVFAFLIMMEDWWGLAFLCALMLSRILNIWVIKQRIKPAERRHPHACSASPCSSDAEGDHHHHHHHHRPQQEEYRRNVLTEYLVDLGPARGGVILRGMADDLQAVTSSAWLRPETFVEGYLEAIAKVLVYLVAAFSGNVTQAASLALMGLLLASAGLLALSNAHARSLRNNGRVVAPVAPAPGAGSGVGRGGPAEKKEEAGRPGDPPCPPASRSDASWPGSGSSAASAFTGMDDWAEKGQIGNIRRGAGGL